MENYAAYMAYTDHQIGRLLDSLAHSGELDNTLVMYIVGDNGASAEGGLEGTFSEVASLVGFNPGLASIVKRIDQIGGPESEPHVPVGWAWAMDAPFQWTKQVASHLGGTRNPMIVHWPKGIKAKGETRTQYHHVIDVVPTLLDAAACPRRRSSTAFPRSRSRASVDALLLRRQERQEQADDPILRNADQPRHLPRWLVGVQPLRRAVEHGGQAGGDFLEAPWELYNLEADFCQADDLAAKKPEKLKELQALFVEEAKKYDVFPLDPRLSERLDSRNRLAGKPRTSWTYYGNNVRLPEPIGPLIYPNSHTITAELTVPEKGCEGVIACAGGISGGWTLYVKDGKLSYHYNFADFEFYNVDAKEALPAGKVTIKLEYVSKGTPKGTTISDGAMVKLFVNGKRAAQGETKKAMFRHGVEPFEIGRDSISPVNKDYKNKGDFAFTGKIDKIRFEVVSMKVGAANPERFPKLDAALRDER